jgi:hypothetical protein
MLSVVGNILTIFVAAGSQNPDWVAGLGFIIPFLAMGLLFLGQFLFIVYGFIGAIMVFQGKPFKYALIGSKVEQFMQPKAETANL